MPENQALQLNILINRVLACNIQIQDHKNQNTLNFQLNQTQNFTALHQLQKFKIFIKNQSKNIQISPFQHALQTRVIKKEKLCFLLKLKLNTCYNIFRMSQIKSLKAKLANCEVLLSLSNKTISISIICSTNEKLFKSSLCYQELDDIKVKPYFDSIEQLFTFLVQNFNDSQVITVTPQGVVRINYPLNKKIKVIELEIAYQQASNMSGVLLNLQQKNQIFRLQQTIINQKSQILSLVQSMIEQKINACASKKQFKILIDQISSIRKQRQQLCQSNNMLVSQQFKSQLNNFQLRIRQQFQGQLIKVQKRIHTIESLIMTNQQKHSQQIQKLLIQLTIVSQEIQFIKQNRAAPQVNSSSERREIQIFDRSNYRDNQEYFLDDGATALQAIQQIFIHPDQKLQSFSQNYSFDFGEKITKTCKGFTMLISEQTLPKSGCFIFTVNCRQITDNYIAIGIVTESDKGKPFSIYSNQTVWYHGKDQKIWYNNSRTQAGDKIESYDQVKVTINLVEKSIQWRFSDKEQSRFALPNHFLEQNLYAAVAIYHQGNSITLN